mgnify:CR=1 FL=1
MSCFEYILFMRKGRAVPINDCGCGDILSVPNVKTKTRNGGNIHDSQKPVTLMQILIENSSKEGDVVLAPFMGSGTTALACIRSRRRFIGSEIDKAFYDIAVRRIIEERMQQTLFRI